MRIAKYCRSLSKLYLFTGNLDQAEEYVTQEIIIMRSPYSSESGHIRLGGIYAQLGGVHHGKGNYTASFKALTRLCRIVEAHNPPVHVYSEQMRTDLWLSYF